MARHARTFTASVAALAALTVLAGISPADGAARRTTTTRPRPTAAPTTAAPTTAAPTTTARQSPARGVAGLYEYGGVLVAAISQDPGQLNPAITTAGAVHAASELMYNGLVELDTKGRPLPSLAESWTVSSGDYTFKLRKGVTWHDGTPFTSADVKYTFEEVLVKFHARTRTSLDGAVFRIETPDPLTVVFRFFKPYAPFLQQLNVTEAPILPRHIFDGTDPTRNPANLRPVGTGPFVFESYRPGAEIRLKANRNYFMPGAPYLDGVVLRVIPDNSTALIALEAGEVDFLYGVNGSDLARVKANKNLGTLETLANPGGSNCTMTMSFNLDRAIFADQRTRLAIFQAIDRKQFLDRILFGQGRVSASPINSGIEFAAARNLAMPAFDRSAANTLLDQVGWKRSGSSTRTADNVAGVRDGTPLRFRFLSFPTFAQYGQLLRAQLAEVGIDVQLETLESGPFSERVFTRRDFDTNVISYCHGTDPEIGARRMYDAAQISSVAFSNSSAYRNPTVTRLFEDAVTAGSTAARAAIYRRIQEILVEEVPYVWLVETTGTRVFRASCEGFGESGHFATWVSCSK